MKRLALLVVVALMVAPAMAKPLVVIDVRLDGAGNFELAANATGQVPGYPGTGNGGLSGFNLVLDSYVSADNLSPKYLDPAAQVFKGFQVGTATWTSPGDLFDGMISSNPDTLLYDVGIAPGDPVGAMLTRGVPWDGPWCVIAAGVGEPDYNACNELILLNRQDPTVQASSANVWTDQGVATVVEADVWFVPEPATMTMLVLGGLAILRRRR